MTNQTADPTCPSCLLPYGLLPGCTAESATRFQVWDGGVYQDACRDCGAHPDSLHHPGCCLAYCVETGLQGLMCEHCAGFHSELFGVVW